MYRMWRNLTAALAAAIFCPASVQAAGEGSFVWELLREPVVEALLAAVIFLSVVAEIKTAGFSGGGLIAAIAGCVLLGANWGSGHVGILEFILYFGGMALIFIDILLLLSGVTAVAGFVCMIAGLYLTFGGDETAVYVLSAALGLSFLGGWWLLRRLPQSRLWQKIVLSSALSSNKGFVSTAENLEPYVGKRGVALSVLRPSGKVKVEERILDAVSEGGFIEKDKEISVLRAESNRLVVKPTE